jgi:hypothetical protein
MSSSQFGEGMMVSLRSTLDYSTVVYATIGAISIGLVFEGAPADHFIRRNTVVDDQAWREITSTTFLSLGLTITSLLSSSAKS